MSTGKPKLQSDVEKIQKIPAVETLLDIICQTTGMGFSAVARVTQTEWITCSVLDKINFGLRPGDELDVKKTICDEIRDSRELVVFDDALEDPAFRSHPVPLLYNIRSYISVPIITREGDFFGTLCAVDFLPHKINNAKTIGLFTSFADLIAFHLEALEKIGHSQTSLANEVALSELMAGKYSKQSADLAQSNKDLMVSNNVIEKQRGQISERDRSIERLNNEIDSFSYISSHDLQEPLRKIQLYSKLVFEDNRENISKKSLEHLVRLNLAAERLQSLITDLFTYNNNSAGKNRFIKSDLAALVGKVLEDLQDDIKTSRASIKVEGDCRLRVIPFQIQQAVYNLISNSLKFAKQDDPVSVKVKIAMINPEDSTDTQGKISTPCCHISVSDTGIGFDMQFRTKIFEIFERLNDDRRIVGTGIGLAIVKRVIDNHHGIITVDGKPGHGATFNLYLPKLKKENT